MKHGERYRQLLSPQLRDRVLKAIQEQGYFEALKVERASVVDAEPHPFVLFEIAQNPVFVARGGGLFLSLDALVEDSPDGRYYLPYVGRTPLATAEDLLHEVSHLRDLLDLIELEPSYPLDAERLGVENIVSPELILESIRFEVRKLFRLEVPAFGRQFDSGTCTIDYPFLFGKKVKYRCESRAEYVTLWTASYLERFSEFFVSRFPDHAARIAELFASATNEFGASDFGDDAAATITSSWNQLSKRVLAQLGLG